MNATRVAERVVVSDRRDGQVVSQVGSHLLGLLADGSGLTAELSAAVPSDRRQLHDRGRMFAQLAVMLAAGGECLADIAALRDQPDLFGDVAADATFWRLLTSLDDRVLDDIRAARALARGRVWDQSGEPDEVVLDVDCTLVEVHSENKEGATPHYKRGYGFHPILCFLDATGEALSGWLRPGNAAANSGADQLAAVDHAVAQLPAAYRQGHGPGDDPDEAVHEILVRTDTAGAVAEFVAGLAARNIRFSVGARYNETFAAAIRHIPEDAWRPAINPDGSVRDGAQVVELDVDLSAWPPGSRAICRRERPHPGAQLRLWDHNGLRHQIVLTNQSGNTATLELRHRAHADVENRVKTLKDCGLERMPFTSYTANRVWTELVLIAGDLLAWLKLHLTGDLAKAEPKRLRYRLLHVAARIIRSARRVVLRLPAQWPWADQLARAYQRVSVLAA